MQNVTLIPMAPPRRRLLFLFALPLCLALASCSVFRPKPPDGPAAALKIGDVSAQFSGVTAFTEGELREVLADPFDTIKNEGLSRATADDAAFFLELHYRKNGYAFASVSYDLLGARQFRLKVDEGPLVILGDIQFTGNSTYRDPVNFREYIIGQTRERFPRSKTDLPYVEADVQKGVELVQRFYLAEGFLDVQTAPTVVEYVNGRTRANLTIVVTEGQRYRFGDVVIDGPLVFEPGEVRGLIADQIPLPYTRPRVDAMQRKLEDFYKKRGYYTAKVTAESDPALADASGRVSARFVVAPGPLYRFDGTRITGVDRLKPQYLRNRFRKLSGQVYDPEKLDEVYQRMIRTGLFNVLRVTPQPQPDNTLRLDIDVKEAKAREVGFSLGYGTFEGPLLGIELRDRNFRGTGRPISLAIDYSTRTLGGELLYLDPYLFETDFELRLRLNALTRKLDGYDKAEAGGLAELARQLTKQIRVSAFILSKKDNITNLTIDPMNAGILEYASNSAGMAASLDYRDNPVSPSRGWVSNVSFDVASTAFGGDLDFVRGTFRFTYFQPLFGSQSKQLFIAGFRAGIVKPFGNSSGPSFVYTDTDPKTPDISRGSLFPIDERFFNGGSTSVRSFGERELGPFDQKSGDPIGGEAFTILNLEYVFPLFLADLRGAVFFDAGNLRPQAEQFGFSNERYGIGAGLRYNLPIGPLRLDYGVNPSPKESESFGAFHFSFGFAF
jgi:outer membrane protein insertion porin family